jgi:MFS transporter, DHA1 family, inner membrane transport protein
VIQDLHLGEAAAGRIGSMEFLAVAIVSVLVALRIQAFPTRPTVWLGVALLIAGNVASAFAHNELLLTGARMLCGVGKGLVVAIVFSLAAGSSRPTRAFAVLNVVYALFSTFFYLVVPYAIGWDGAGGAFLSMGGVAILGALFMPFFPAGRLATSEISGLRLRDLPTFGFLAFLALVILWSGHNMVFTFIERIGVRNGMDVKAIGAVLSLSAFLTIAGPGLARTIDTRFGYGVPMVVAILCGDDGGGFTGGLARRDDHSGCRPDRAELGRRDPFPSLHRDHSRHRADRKPPWPRQGRTRLGLRRHS